MQRTSLLAVLLGGLLAGCTVAPEKPEANTPLALRGDAGAASVREQAPRSDKSVARDAKKEKNPQAEAKYVSDLAEGKDSERHGNLTEARATYERLIASCPNRYEAYHRLAVVADRQRRYDEAQALYTQAIRRNGRNPDLFNDLGYCFYLQGKMDKAQTALLKAVAMRPAEARYRNNLGLVYGMQGRYEEALEQYRRADGEGNAYYNLAFVKAARNDLAGAEECFRQALAVDPTNNRARQALASFESSGSRSETLATMGPTAEDGTVWVPYVEDDKSNNQVVAAQAVTAKNSTVAQRVVAASATQGLVDKAAAYSAAANPPSSR
jgi:Flp pilus assembly protein TadD